MVLGGELGGRCGFDGHEGLPHIAIEEMALFGEAAVVHLGPVVVDDGGGVGAALLFEEDALWGWQTFGDAVDIAQGVGFEVGVEVGIAEVSPDGIKHEAEYDGVGGAENTELPADEVVMNGALFAWPEAVEKGQEQHGAGHRDDENDDVLRESKHKWRVSPLDGLQAYRILSAFRRSFFGSA